MSKDYNKTNHLLIIFKLKNYDSKLLNKAIVVNFGHQELI